MTEQPAPKDLQPLNELEEKLARGEQPDANPVDVILAFLNNEVYIVSQDVLEGPDSEVEPLVLANSSGQPVLAVFSHPSRVAEQYLAAAPQRAGHPGRRGHRQPRGRAWHGHQPRCRLRIRNRSGGRGQYPP